MHPPKFCFDKVIIIDDSEVDRYIATYFIKKESVAKEIIEFELAQPALDFLKENKSDFKRLNILILLDIQMPHMNGFTFLEKMHDFLSKEQNYCVVVLSSSIDISDYKKAGKSPFVKKFIHKPLNETKIQEIKKCCLLLQEDQKYNLY